jgi:hypothetical protein
MKGGEGMEPDDLLCSRNARPPKALVGRAQWKINQPPSPKRERAGLEGTFRQMTLSRARSEGQPLRPSLITALSFKIALLFNQGCMDNSSPNQFRSFMNLPIMSQICPSAHPH